MADPTLNKHAVRRFFEALTRSDRLAMAELMHDDVTWAIPRSSPEPYAGTHVGRETVLDMMLGASEQIFVPGTHRVDIELLLAEDDLACAEITMRARTPAGKDYENTYVFLFRFEDGRIRDFREHLDTRYAAPFLEL